ncbi:RraA family protein [Amycolatopsis carbonis]|uniref:Putative 4-hydroxy-4-methyl-2-oxoglutarate aldolase n=1 Tax=Amycolatopsis carbonis TaxID=715471 RepID=A0A9Y2IEN2_9PSEU|nr:RraA family protein [Amycolatopsis sp. 2-15]WIX76978.1 RraA family protein [Amycolatopsis sp. 2-15]
MKEYGSSLRKIVSKVDRPSVDTVRRYEDFYSALISDVLGKHQVMHVDLAPLSPGMRFCGPAVTSLGPDLTVRRMAIDLAEPGDVLVVAAGAVRDYACFGDGTAQRMMNKPMAAAVIDGCVRDAAGIRRLGFPTFALGTTPRNYHYPASGDHGAVNVPVICGGVYVEPGDLVFGDDDGAVVVPRALAAEVADEVVERITAERALRASWTGCPPFAVEEELVRRGYSFQ